MAEKLMLYYRYVTDEVGFQGQLKLAMATKIPSTKTDWMTS